MAPRDALVVDDEPDSREALARLLQTHGYTVREAENGKIALDRIAERVPCILLLDVEMPVMNGWEVLASLPLDVLHHLLRHFPEGVRVYTEEETRGESRGEWYVRQMNGSANLAEAAGSTCSRATSATRSSTTSSPICRRPAIRRSRRASESCAEGTVRPTAPAPFRRQFGSVVAALFRHALPA